MIIEEYNEARAESIKISEDFKWEHNCEIHGVICEMMGSVEGINLIHTARSNFFLLFKKRRKNINQHGTRDSGASSNDHFGSRDEI